MTPKQKAWAIQAEHVIKQMERRHFNAYYCSTKEEALSKALSIIEKESVIASGGSATIEEVGLLNYIKTHSEEYTFIDRSIAKNEEEKRQIHAKAILSDYYLMSTNAFTMDGQLVNIDGNGNRVSALCYGPKHVVIITGMNKLTPSVEDAYNRIRQHACPPTSVLLGLPTPCSKTGVCGDCMSASSICDLFVTTRMSRYPDRIHIIMVGEELGY